MFSMQCAIAECPIYAICSKAFIISGNTVLPKKAQALQFHIITYCCTSCTVMNMHCQNVALMLCCYVKQSKPHLVLQTHRALTAARYTYNIICISVHY